MSTPPPKDVPPARRQPTEISMAEIESLQPKPQPQKKGGAKFFFAFLLLAGLGGVGFWQWPWIQPRLAAAMTTVAGGSSSLLEKVRPGQRDNAAAEGSASSGTDATTEGQSGASSDTGSVPKNVADSVSVPPINSDPVAVDASEEDDPDAAAEPDVLLNHRRYEVVEAEALVPLNASSDIRLQPEAQRAIAQMITKAKIEGVQLGIISGFRTLEDQDYLYFDVKAERGQSAKTRAEVSAPPGYSEHHTGYAVDFIDESRADTHLSESFETTAAFQWLEKNAPYFNFEMSFPKDNPANVSYEPWHWRYVGNQESLELFYK